MKKILLLIFATIVTTALVQAQVIINENFDSYSSGDKIAQTAGAPWTTWSNSPGGGEDGTVSNIHANSGSNSLFIAKDNDCVLRLGDSTSGVYKFSMMLFTPIDTLSYFNILHVFNGSSSSWAADFYSVGYDSTFHIILQGNDTAQATAIASTWYPFELNVDMDNNEAKLLINNNVLFTWPWTLTSGDTTLGPNQLGAADFYGYDLNGAVNSGFYIDDVKLEKTGTSISVTPAANEVSLKMYPNPASNTLNINSSRAFKNIRIYDIAGAEVMNVQGGTGIIMSVDISSLSSGVYYVSFNYGDQIVVRKLVKE